VRLPGKPNSVPTAYDDSKIGKIPDVEIASLYYSRSTRAMKDLVIGEGIKDAGVIQ